VNIFVYGTLKSGYKGSFLLKDADYIGEVSTKPIYRLYTNEIYPCMKKSNYGKSIKGELYSVSISTLKQLNNYEGVDEGLFSLSFIEIELDSCSNNKNIMDSGLCLGYLYLGDISNMREISFWSESKTYEHSENRA
jgi:gamma-glutamylcyclotransferase (GGCT)/AIG2-like uncharacterized protein YtfP